MNKWVPLIILAVAQFIMVLDSTVMNVSISTVAADLGTTISGMQAAITLYALTMAAFMLIGGKMGEKIGRSKAFIIGVSIYGLGSLITALSPNLVTLLFGWSLVEGIGAVLVIPAIAALAAVNYKGNDRLKAFAVLGAIAGLAAAVGPVIGGLVTTYLSWRYVFAAETVIVCMLLIFAKKLSDSKSVDKVSIDVPSALLSASGMALIVFGALQSKTWGWILPQESPTGATPASLFGISLVAYCIVIGVVLLYIFLARQSKLEQSGGQPLLTVSLLKKPALRSGLSVLLAQYFAIAAIFFVMPVYLQILLGYDALKTGLHLLPLSVGLIIFTVIGSRMTSAKGPRRVVLIGQVTLAVGSFLLLLSITPTLANGFFTAGLVVVGAALGLLASQIGNVNMSAVPKRSTSEVGGLQGTYQNLGGSFGTAIAGSVFILVMSSGFVAQVDKSSLDPTLKQAITTQTSGALPILSPSDAQGLLESRGVSTQTADEVSELYVDAQLDALRVTMFTIAVVSLLSLLVSRNLPGLRADE